MKILHISPSKNTESILKYGILKRPPFLSQFKEFLELHLREKYNHKEGIIFSIPEDVLTRDKYIKDFIYWKVWGHPRNVLLDTLYKKYYYADILDSGPSIFKSIKLEEEEFTIFEADIDDNFTTVSCIHAQFHCMSPVWDDMDSKYEHEDKPLVLINDNIPSYKLKIIGEAKTLNNKNKRIDISMNI